MLQTLQEARARFENTYQNEFAVNDELQLVRANFAAAFAAWDGSALSVADNLALYELGELFFFGDRYVEKNESLAFQLFLRAAENGYKAAYNKVGECYFNGTGTHRNIPQAVEWFRKDNPALLKKTTANYLSAAKNAHPDFVMLYEFAACAGNAEALQWITNYRRTKNGT